MLVFRYEGLVRAKVLLKVSRSDADDLVATVFMSVLNSIFSGQTPAEFRAWLMTITKRRIADYHRSGGFAAGMELFDPTGSDEETTQGPAEPSSGGEIERAEAGMLIQEMLTELGEAHRLVVQLYVLEGHAAAECCDRVNSQLGASLTDPMTEANVHQIASRFRATLREALAGGSPEAAHG